MAYLQITNFCKNFGNLNVLKGIDLSMEKGEVLSIIGSSGSGKTTLLRCINFLETPNEGVMTLDGETLFDGSVQTKDNDATLRQKRLNFGLVFQSFNLFPQYTVMDNITLAPKLLLKEKLAAYKKSLKGEKTLSRRELKIILSDYKTQNTDRIFSDAEELLKRVGLEDKRDYYPCQLSGGQKQRVAIARALALKPQILCFDEPTSALDPELTGEVLKVIRSLKGNDTTMIIVTHEMEFARSVSDKVVFMADGVVEEEGAPEQVFDNPKSDKLKNFLRGNRDEQTEDGNE